MDEGLALMIPIFYFVVVLIGFLIFTEFANKNKFNIYLTKINNLDNRLLSLFKKSRLYLFISLGLIVIEVFLFELGNSTLFNIGIYLTIIIFAFWALIILILVFKYFLSMIRCSLNKDYSTLIWKVSISAFVLYLIGLILSGYQIEIRPILIP